MLLYIFTKTKYKMLLGIIIERINPDLRQMDILTEILKIDCPPTTTTNECPGYDTKQSDSEVPAVLELWGMRSTPFIAIAPRSTLAPSGSTW